MSDRHGHGRDRRRAAVAQEEEHHEDHQQHGDGERALDFAKRGADRDGALHRHVEVHVRRDRGAQLGQQLLHPVHRLDDVRIGLPVDDEQHGGLAVGHAVVAQVLHAVLDAAQVAQAHRGAVAVRHDDRHVLGCLLRLVVGLDLPVVLAVVQETLGPVRVGGRDRGAHVVEADAELVQDRGIELHAHGR
jgi:hypothetical protein